MFLLVPAHLGCPRQIPQSRKTVVCVCVDVCTAPATVIGVADSLYLFFVRNLV